MSLEWHRDGRGNILKFQKYRNLPVKSTKGFEFSIFGITVWDLWRTFIPESGAACPAAGTHSMCSKSDLKG